MNIDVVLGILKFTAILVSGIAGILGLLVNYKDHDGRITRWGRRALLIVVTSTIVAASIQGIEINRERRRALIAEKKQLDEVRRNTLMLTDMRRSLFRFNRAYFTTDIQVSLSDGIWQRYGAALYDVAKKLPLFETSIEAYGLRRVSRALSMSPGNDLYPHDRPFVGLLQLGAHGEISPHDMKVDLNSTDLSIWSFSVVPDKTTKPDIYFEQRVEGNDGDPGPLLWWTISAPIKTNFTTSRLISLVDFDGAILTLTPDTSGLDRLAFIAGIKFRNPRLILDDYQVDLSEITKDYKADSKELQSYLDRLLGDGAQLYIAKLPPEVFH